MIRYIVWLRMRMPGGSGCFEPLFVLRQGTQSSKLTHLDAWNQSLRISGTKRLLTKSISKVYSFRRCTSAGKVRTQNVPENVTATNAAMSGVTSPVFNAMFNSLVLQYVHHHVQAVKYVHHVTMRKSDSLPLRKTERCNSHV
jgi:hypothetical protein